MKQILYILIFSAYAVLSSFWLSKKLVSLPLVAGFLGYSHISVTSEAINLFGVMAFFGMIFFQLIIAIVVFLRLQDATKNKDKKK